VFASFQPCPRGFAGVPAIQGTLSDISWLAGNETELIEEKERLETILGSIGAGLMIVDRNRNAFYANEIMQARFARTGKRLCYSFYGRSEPCEGCVLEQVLAGSEQPSISVKGEDSSGRECWLELLCSPVRDKEGEIIVALEVAMDISEKKRLAERVRVLAEAVENMHEGVAVADLQGRLIYANKSLCRQIQRPVSELEGMTLAGIYRPAEEKHLPLERWLEGRQERLSGEFLCKREDGESLPVLLSAFRIDDAQGRSYALVAVALDLTERKRLEADLVQSSKLAALGELISGIPHELNNPLAAIMGYSQLVMRRIDPNDDSEAAKLRKSARAIFGESERASNIIRNLLTFARRYKTEKNPVDINEVLESTFDLRGYDLRVNNVRVETDYAQGLPMIMADFNQLQQVILNLVNNAVHAMLEHGGERLIRVRTSQQGPNLVVEFSDTGPGIPEKNVQKIFDPFFTTKEVGKGTGLGLSICFGIVKEHGGSIGVTSPPGGGAMFRIELPVCAKGKESFEEIAEQEAEPVRPPKRILVVDDEVHIRDILQEYLAEENFQVETASDGFAALELLGRKTFDLIITDIKMPRIDGRLLYEAIRRQSPELARRVIFATGDTLSRETNRFIEKTGNPNLRKPIKLEKVLQAIDAVLEKEPDSRS
jgi:two-component system NtrC family sensor kinase